MESHRVMGRRRIHRDGRTKTRYHRYGLTGEQIDQLADSQGNGCLICSAQVPLQVDHSHETGRFRALLCMSCNTGLGKFRDDPRLLRRAAAYLSAFGTSHPDPRQMLLDLRRIGGF